MICFKCYKILLNPLFLSLGNVPNANRPLSMSTNMSKFMLVGKKMVRLKSDFGLIPEDLGLTGLTENPDGGGGPTPGEKRNILLICTVVGLRRFSLSQRNPVFLDPRSLSLLPPTGINPFVSLLSSLLPKVSKPVPLGPPMLWFLTVCTKL